MFAYIKNDTNAPTKQKFLRKFAKNSLFRAKSVSLSKISIDLGTAQPIMDHPNEIGQIVHWPLM